MHCWHSCELRELNALTNIEEIFPQPAEYESSSCGNGIGKHEADSNDESSSMCSGCRCRGSARPTAAGNDEMVDVDRDGEGGDGEGSEGGRPRARCHGKWRLLWLAATTAPHRVFVWLRTRRRTLRGGKVIVPGPLQGGKIPKPAFFGANRLRILTPPAGPPKDNLPPGG